MNLVVLFLVMLSPLLACDMLGGQLNPKLKKKLDAYEKFIISLQSEKNPLRSINRWIKKEGILLDAYINERLVKNYPSSFSDDSPTNSRKLFLKNLKLPPGLSNEVIYEVASPKANRTIRSWQIPANAVPLGIRGEEILYRAYLGTPCSNFKRDVLIAISSKGTFRAIDDVSIPEVKYLDKCPAAQEIFKTSAYDSCMEVQDVKSKKKRIIVYQSPIT